jgi:Chondroitinase B/Immunoglobulin domain
MHPPLRRFWLCLLLIATFGHPLSATIYNVGTISNLQTRINAAVAGDQIILSNGVYNSTGTISVSCAGTASQPILITAQTIGGAQIGGTNGFNFIGANYVTIQGFYFTYTNSGTQGLIVDTASTHCRITRNIFETDPVQYWCFVQGDDTEVDHNLFRNKSAKGEYITLEGSTSGTTITIPQRLWAHDNDLFNNHYAGGNGGESTRLGTGTYKLLSSWSVIENNLYEQANGDPEAVSIKTSDNVIRYNTITNNLQGTISLRQGCRNRIEGNFILNADGMKFYADDHLIFNNYLSGTISGIQFGAGDWAEITDSDNNATGPHAAAHRARVEFNTMVNCSVYLDWNNQGSYVPTDCIVENNILEGNSGYFVSQALSTNQSNFTWKTNIFWGSASTAYSPAGGYLRIDPLLATNTATPFHIAASSPAISASYAAPGEVVSDMDGQSRPPVPAIGADEYSTAPVTRRPLSTNDVGPYVAATNFAIVAMPWIQTVMQGNSTSFTNLISAFNGFTNTVTLTVTNLPTNASASFSSASVVYGTNGFDSSVLTVITSNSTPPGRYTLLITASSATFTNTTIACFTVGNLPTTNWTDTDINNPILSGSADYYMNVFAVKGSGSQIYGASDQFNYAYQPWTNGLTATARVITQPQTSVSAKSGVMIRETTNANSKFVHVVVTPIALKMEARTTTGGSAVTLANFTAANSSVGTNSPSWVRLVRSGNTFTGYASSNGVNWVQMGVTNFSMASTTLAGLAVCGYDNTRLNTSTFDNVKFLATNNPPVISNQPVGVSVNVSNSATFTVGVTGDLPLKYQWFFNATNAIGINTNFLTLNNVQATNTGNYTVVITNASGSTTSAPAVLTLIVILPPVITNSIMTANQGSFTLTGIGAANQTNILWMTTNLNQPMTNWLPIATNITDTNGIFSFTDTQISNSAQRFYRTTLP